MKKGIFKRYLIFAKAGFQTLIAYRGNVMLWLFGSLLSATLMGLLWWAIYSFSDSGVIGGFTYPQMLLYVILSAAMFEITMSDSMGMIMSDIRDGLIGMRLMKPISYRLQLMFTSLGIFIGKFIIFGIPTVIVGTLIAVLGFGLTGLVWYNVLLFVPALVLAFLVNEAYDFLFGQLAFRTQATFGINSMSMTISGFLSGRMVPLSVFPQWAQKVLNFTPFPFMMSMPIRLYLGVVSLPDVALSFAIAIAWIIVINIIGKLSYMSSVRKVVVFGG
ncbi:MAG: ABC-2 family transporter protein [Clostridiales bacterium]|nr:ABC-2 family transporter protein [Clostridiales bacterium]